MELVDQMVEIGCSFIVDPFHGHLTAVKTRYDHILGSCVELFEVACFFEGNRSPSNSFLLDRRLEYFYKKSSAPLLGFA